MRSTTKKERKTRVEIQEYEVSFKYNAFSIHIIDNRVKRLSKEQSDQRT